MFGWINWKTKYQALSLHYKRVCNEVDVIMDAYIEMCKQNAELLQENEQLKK